MHYNTALLPYFSTSLPESQYKVFKKKDIDPNINTKYLRKVTNRITRLSILRIRRIIGIRFRYS